MAATEYGVNHPLAVKKWSSDLMKEMLKRTYVLRFIGKGSDSVIQWKDDLSKNQGGDRIRVGLRVQLAGDGIQGDGTLEGNEEALTTYYDDLVIDQLRHATRSAGKMSEQRVPFDVRLENRDGLADWWADRWDTWFFNQVCGNTGESDTKYTGNQATVAPDTDHWIYAGGKASEATLSDVSSDYFSLTLIDYAVERATSFGKGSADWPNSMPMRPKRIMGEEYFVMFLHPYQVTDLRTSTDTGQWLDIQKAAMQGGQVTRNPIFTGALGMYNGVILHTSTRIPAVVSNTRRAVMVGAQAACMGFGKETSSPNRMSWVEELFDYGNQLGVSAGAIAGLKKTRFNSRDFGSIVVSTYAAKHS